MRVRTRRSTGMADRLAHAPHLAVAALVDRDAQEAGVEQRDLGRRGAAVVELDALAQPARARRGDGSPSTSARYSLSTPKLGWVRRWVRSPSLVSSSRPSVSASSRPTGNTRGSAGTRSTTVGRPCGSRRGGDDARRLVEQVVDEARPSRRSGRRRPRPRRPRGRPAGRARRPRRSRAPGAARSGPRTPAGCRARPGPAPSGGGRRRPRRAPALLLVVVEVVEIDLVEVGSRAARSSPRTALAASISSSRSPSDGPGRRAQPGLEVLDHVGAGHELAERRELVEGVEAEPLEEQRRGAEQDRLARDPGPCRPRR